MMIPAFLALALINQAVPAELPTRASGKDVYCAAVGLVLTEREQAAPTSPQAEAGLLTMTLFYLGRVEGSLPDQNGIDVVLTMASVMNPSNMPPNEIAECGRFMQSRVETLVSAATAEGRRIR